LNRSSEFDWKKPADLEFGRINIPLLDQEKSARARRNQVSTYSTHELRTLWEYATPFQRLIILLGLNCGFGRAELASLEMADVLLHQKHPHEHDVGFPSTSNDSWIIRVRHKSGVYGEWKLWPETVNALDWWLRQRSEIAAGQGIQNLLITNTGHRIDLPTKGNNQNSLITNRWWELLRRVRKDQPSFRCLSFGKLRKTSGNLIRSVAGGEIAAVFLCHGIPLGSDELLDVYTNRPFAKVFSALENIGERLRPIWTAVPEAFPEKPKKGGANISLAKIRRIQSMKKQGFKDVYIANELGISVETVRRRTLPDANSDAASRS
jgi:hypothetical protein